jgi:RimJ/RimL family protein N-acetyltransferase
MKNINDNLIAETERLRIRKYKTEDAETILQLLNSDGWIRNIGDRNIRSVADAEKYINDVLRKGYDEMGYGFYALELKEDGSVIGMAGLVKRPELDNSDIGFALLPVHEGKGFAHEACKTLMEVAKNEFGLQRLLAIVLESNTRSVGLLERLGFTRRGIENIKGEDLLVLEKEL